MAHRRAGHSKYEASPLAADGKIYLVNFDGQVSIIDAATGKLLRVIEMDQPADGEMVPRVDRAAPAICSSARRASCAAWARDNRGREIVPQLGTAATASASSSSLRSSTSTDWLIEMPCSRIFFRNEPLVMPRIWAALDWFPAVSRSTRVDTMRSRRAMTSVYSDPRAALRWLIHESLRTDWPGARQPAGQPIRAWNRAPGRGGTGEQDRPDCLDHGLLERALRFAASFPARNSGSARPSSRTKNLSQYRFPNSPVKRARKCSTKSGIVVHALASGGS